MPAAPATDPDLQRDGTDWVMSSVLDLAPPSPAVAADPAVHVWGKRAVGHGPGSSLEYNLEQNAG